MSKTLKVLCVCQNGVGSSVMLRVFVDKALTSLGITDKTIDVSDASTAGGLARNCDVIMCNNEIAEVLKKYGKPVLGLKNMTSKKEITEKFSEYLGLDK